VKKINRYACTTASAVALAVSVLMAPATASADDGPHPEVGTHCTPWQSVYGRGHYTFTDFRVCVDIGDREGRAAVSIQTDRNTYWHGGVWWSTTEGYPAHVGATVKINASPHQGGPSVTQPVSWKQESRSDEEGRGIGIIKCGVRHLDVSYHQVGGYYHSDKAIAVKRSYDDFLIPCSFN
jgi:hypothetical protein